MRRRRKTLIAFEERSEGIASASISVLLISHRHPPTSHTYILKLGKRRELKWKSISLGGARTIDRRRGGGERIWGNGRLERKGRRRREQVPNWTRLVGRVEEEKEEVEEEEVGAAKKKEFSLCAENGYIVAAAGKKRPFSPLSIHSLSPSLFLPRKQKKKRERSSFSLSLFASNWAESHFFLQRKKLFFSLLDVGKISKNLSQGFTGGLFHDHFVLAVENWHLVDEDACMAHFFKDLWFVVIFELGLIWYCPATLAF